MRAFIAVEPTEPVRAAIAAVQQNLRNVLGVDDSRHVRCTWVRPDALHLTIRFFADFKDDGREAFRAALTANLGTCAGVAMPLDRLGVYPRLANPRVIWLGPQPAWSQSDEGRRLTAVWKAVDDSCRRLGITNDEEGEWRPHLTLARIRSGERQAGQRLEASGLFGSRPAIALDVRSVDFVKSELTPNGPRHTVLWSASL